MNDTNTQERERGERIAHILMKALAFVGLVAILALAAWGVARLVGLLPSVQSTLTGRVVSLDTLLSRDGPESLQFSLGNNVLNASEEVTLSFLHNNPKDTNNRYTFSYECKDRVLFDIYSSGTWNKTMCNTAYQFSSVNGRLQVIPTSNEKKYVDVALTIAVADTQEPVRDSVVVTVVNEDVTTDVSADTQDTTTEQTERPTTGGTNTVTNTQAPRTNTVATPVQPTPPTQQTFVPRPTVVGPADLAVTITGTGLLLKSSGKNTFVARSPIPSDADAAVRFTVVNRGGKDSGPWGFTANLPIEGDPDYKYTSPIQSSLRPGDRVEFTLGFDDVRNAKTGAITITLTPSDATDQKSNNRDTSVVSIKQK